MAETLTPLETIPQDHVDEFLRAIELLNANGGKDILKIARPCLLRNENCPDIDLFDSELFDIDFHDPLCGVCIKSWKDQAKIILNIIEGNFNKVWGPARDTNTITRSALHREKGGSLSIEHNKGKVVFEYHPK
jgi:hypothetical protein